MLYDPYKFSKDNIVDLDEALDTRIAKSGDIMTGDLNIFGDNDLIYEGTIAMNTPVSITNGSTISVTVGSMEVYSGAGATNRPVYLINESDGETACVPYDSDIMAYKNHSWSAKIYKSNTFANIYASGSIVDGRGNILSQKADKSALNSKTDTSVIAGAFSTLTSYAVGDYVMRNGVLYKCTTAHTGAWVDADFTETKVSDEFGSGGGGGADLSVIAAEFSTSTSYAVGDYVTYNGKFYRCTTAHPAGAWNASHFTETTVDDELDTKMTKGVDYVTAGQKANTTLGTKATAEGYNTTASKMYSHAEGNITTASGAYAHSEGSGAVASHEASHAEGRNTNTGNAYQHVQGKYNVGKSTTAFEIGNGTANNARSNAFEVDWDGDTTAAGEITDGGGNVLSDKYDATSLTFPNERFTISASGWSSTQTGGYYTYTLSTGDTKYNTYCPVFMDKTGVNDSTDPTSAEEAAYALVDKFDMADGTGVNSFTLYAKTKPTTTFYIKLSGQYMAKNAASSSKALDIETANALTTHIKAYNEGAANYDDSIEFNGGAVRQVSHITDTAMFYYYDWSATVNSSGYYTQTVSLNQAINGHDRPDVSLVGIGAVYSPTSAPMEGASLNVNPTAAQGAAYNLVDYFEVADSSNVTQITAYAKTKPTESFGICIKGMSIS